MTQLVRSLGSNKYALLDTPQHVSDVCVGERFWIEIAFWGKIHQKIARRIDIAPGFLPPSLRLHVASLTRTIHGDPGLFV